MHGCTSLTPLSAIAFDLVLYNVLTDTANVCNLQQRSWRLIVSGVPTPVDCGVGTGVVKQMK